MGVYPAGAKLLAFAIGAAFAGVTGAVYAGQLGYIEPGQFDLTLSLMVLAAVLIGGRWGIAGVVLGALTVAAYDRVLADLVSDLVHGLGSLSGLTALASLDLRTQNYLMFGVALYLAILFRTRGIPDPEASPSPPAWRRSRIAWGRSR